MIGNCSSPNANYRNSRHSIVFQMENYWWPISSRFSRNKERFCSKNGKAEEFATVKTRTITTTNCQEHTAEPHQWLIYSSSLILLSKVPKSIIITSPGKKMEEYTVASGVNDTHCKHNNVTCNMLVCAHISARKMARAIDQRCIHMHSFCTPLFYCYFNFIVHIGVRLWRANINVQIFPYAVRGAMI